jgi:hypothetical protein
MRILMLLGLFCAVLLVGTPARANSQWSISTGDTAVFASDSIVAANERYSNIVVLYGRLDFRGQAQKMVVLAGHVKLRSGAKITESLVVMGGSVDQEDGAIVAGDAITFKAPEGWYRTLLILSPVIGALFSGGLWIISSAAWIFTSWGLGLLLLYLFPRFRECTNTIMRSQKALAFLWACGGLLAFVPGFVLLLISILGIALIPLYLAMYGFCYYLAHMIGSLWFGGAVLGLMGKQWAWQWQLLMGLFLTVAIGTLVPFIGKIFLFYITYTASGAVWKAWKMGVFGNRN